MTIRYLSAGDRINYGDFLFSIIFKEYFQGEFNIEYYGVVESDFSKFGAVKTKSFKHLTKEIDHLNDVVIIGGGEVFFGKWQQLFSYINPAYKKLYQYKLVKMLEDRLNIANFVLGNKKSLFPFVPNLGVEAIYIAAGGQFTNHLKIKEEKYLIANLSDSKYLSVRDSRTKASLESRGILPKLLPDSAVLMSRVFTKEELKVHASRNDLIGMEDDYLFLQAGITKGPKDLKKFSNDINKLSKEFGLQVLCCPIGTAPGHEDHIILENLCKLNKEWIFINPNSVYQIMHLIANSKFYLGTSLHGAITAFAFNKPFIGLNPKVKKINSFVRTWCQNISDVAVEYSDVYVGARRIVGKWDDKIALNHLEYCQNLVEQYFNDIKVYLKEKRR